MKGLKKKVLCLWAILLGFTIESFSAPVDPFLKKVLTLENGEQIECRQVGDEFCHFWIDREGRKYLKSPYSEKFFQASDSEISKREAKGMQMRKKERIEPFAPTQSLEGNKRMLVILIDFPDVQFKSAHDANLYNNILNTTDYTDNNGFVGSVHDYFLDQSYEKLDLNFDIIGPLTMSEPTSYYGEDAEDGTTDIKFQQMIEEACTLADEYVDYRDYVWEGTSTVSTVNIIYAGMDQAAGGTDSDIWAKCSSLRTKMLDGVLLNRVACSSELRTINNAEHINGIGAFCHELSHGFGLGDMYDQETGNYGTQVWDVMGMGCYKDNSFRPSGFTAFDKYQLGWITPITLYSDTTVSDMPSLSDVGVAYKIQNSNCENEFYLLENRQTNGWDSTLPGHGMLITHVDYDKDLFDKNVINRTGIKYGNDHERCGLVLADNDPTIDYTNANNYYNDYQGDLWPYNGNNSLTKTSTPAAKLYNKSTDGTYYLGKDITNIRENSDGTISFAFTNNVDKNYYGLSIQEDSTEFISESSIKVITKIINLQEVAYDKKIKSVVCKKQGDTFEEISDTKTTAVDIEANSVYSYNVEFENLPIDTLGTEFYVNTYYEYTKTNDEWNLLTSKKICIDDLKSNYLTVSDNYSIKTFPDSTATLTVNITNHSFLPYDRYIGLYTYFKEDGQYVIQTPRDFKNQTIYPYGTAEYTFNLKNLERDKTYFAYLFYYPTTEANWLQLSSQYVIVVNDATLLAKIEETPSEQNIEEGKVYNLNGIFVTTIKSNKDIQNLTKGLYIIVKNNGESYKMAIK